MLRGYSRHDGISNKQSAKERDRDRQREKQRQERALMLPNDDKDINTSAQDLFHAPVKVDPSVEDRTTVEIRNTLGNFESVRHYMVDSGRSLIGVDQNSNQSSVHSSLRTPVRPSQSSSSSSKTSVPSNRNYPLSSTGVTNHANSVGVPPSSSKVNPPKVPPSQNQLSHPSSQSGNNLTSNSVSVSHGHLNSKKSQVYNTSNNCSGSVDTGGVPPSLSVDKNLNNNSVSTLNLDTFCADNTNDKNDKGSSLKKPALERADSQLELESMLKEMMDVTAPLTAIQTPAKESLAKKYTPRRASKSEEKIVQIIGMTNIPSPIKKMDSSESSSSETESSGSDSEDSSSGSQGGVENPDHGISKPAPATNSPTRWNLSSFIRKDNIKGTPGPDSSGAAAVVKSPKDVKPTRDTGRTSSTFDCAESPDVPLKIEPSVTSTSIFGKSMSASPVENVLGDGKFTSKSSGIPHTAHLETIDAPYSKVPGKSPRKTPDVKGDILPPLKPPASTIPMKGPPASVPKIASLSATSSEDEEKKSIETSRPSHSDKSRSQGGTSAGKRKRPRRSSSSSERHLHKSDEDDSSPEADKTKKVVQDRNKSDTIRKLFRPSRKNKEKIESPSVNMEGSKVNANSSANSNSRGKGSKPSTSNRVSAKDSGRKSNSSSTPLVHNGDINVKTGAKSSTTTSNPGKKRENTGKDTKTSHSSSHHHSKKHSHKSISGSQKNSSEGLVATNNVINTNPSIAALSRNKDEQTGKSHPSSLMCRIPLFKIPRPPGPPTTTINSSSSSIKSEKETDKGGGASSGPLGISDSAQRVRLHYDSSRVGSSSDHASNNAIHDPAMDRQRDDSLGSDSERLSSKNHSSHKRVRKKAKVIKKNSKIKLEPDSHSKIDEDSSVVCGEVSSNVFGYTSCDSVSVSTTRTPPVELDMVQAPDSSINPLHLPSPVVPPQPVYYSYFERNETHEEYYSRDQDTYLEEAKRLKHKADGEKVSTTQASTYLEAGLYFILTGISMERDHTVGSQSAFTMYKDTLSLIRYIGARFRSGRTEYSNELEAKIIVLSMRCQALLSLKLFKLKMRETKDCVQYLTEHFSKAPPVDVVPVPSSPQLSTPSPHSPTSSPAGSSGLHQGHTPSPHPHQNHVTTVPRYIYSQMYKQCTSTMNLIQSHELWETADNLVERYHMEDFFISIDRQYGPLTLHNSLVDLVRYVKHCLKVLKICSDIS